MSDNILEEIYATKKRILVTFILHLNTFRLQQRIQSSHRSGSKLHPMMHLRRRANET